MDLFGQTTLIFLAAALLACALPLPTRLRRALLLGFNAYFLYTFDPLAPVLFLATSVAGFGAAKIGARGGSTASLALCLTPLLIPLFLPKLDWLLDLSGGATVGNAVGARAAIFIGASYFTLRAISFALDARRNGALHFGFFDYLVYNSFFPTIIAGPIERADHFAKTFDRLGKPDLDDIAQGVLRIVYGLAKKVLLGSIAASWAAPVMKFGFGATIDTGDAWISLYAWLLYTYFDFAGYSDLAIGAARLFGIKLAENFDHPFLKPSIAEFWKGWHLSLSFFIRDYIFLPLAGRSASSIRPHVAALTAMTLCGIWHSPNLGWMLWGVAHGAGLSIHQAWTLWLRKNFKLKKKLQASIPFRIVSVFVTFNFVAFTWTLVIDPLDLGVSLEFWKVLLGIG